MSRKTSLKYSFMLYFPVSIATMLLGVGDIISSGITLSLFGYYLVGMVFAFVGTYLAYKWLTAAVEKGKLWHFSLYLFLVSIFTIIYFI
jgi:undecaprenyl-diphosphatase